MTKITKAVFPVAGLGTRFLPATKASPKEMMPVVDKPLIQYAVQEAIAAGIKDLIFVTSHGKRAIEDHFDKNVELENNLKGQEKVNFLQEIQNIIPDDVNCIYVRQADPRGLGHAVLCASSVIDENEYFAVILADDLIYAEEKLCLSQMIEQFNNINKSIIAVQTVPNNETEKYGIVSVDNSKDNIAKISSIIEKPKPKEAPSNLGVVGRYILSGKIFNILRDTKPGVGKEIQLTDAILNLIKYDVYAYKFLGKRYDCGSKLGYMQACVDYALLHPALGEKFKQYLKHIVNDKPLIIEKTLDIKGDSKFTNTKNKVENLKTSVDELEVSVEDLEIFTSEVF